jgi:hypothetical protein
MAYKFGRGSDQPIVGDWDGDGTDEIGVHRGAWFLLDLNGNGSWDRKAGGDMAYRFGKAGDQPVVGDWDGDGTDEIGVHRRGRFLLDVTGNGTWDRKAGGDAAYKFGSAKAQPVVGDWDGDGTDEIGVHRGNKFILDSNGNGQWDKIAGGDNVYTFGAAGDTPLVGNWVMGSPLLAESGVAETHVENGVLSRDLVTPVLQHATDVWSAQPLSSQQRTLLQHLDVQLADLPDAQLGYALGTAITLDVDAAGHGWFVDPTPWENSEFAAHADIGELGAHRGTAAQSRMDLLSVVFHEIGHVLGHEHHSEGVMQETRALASRQLLEHDLFPALEAVNLDEIAASIGPESRVAGQYSPTGAATDDPAVPVSRRVIDTVFGGGVVESGGVPNRALSDVKSASEDEDPEEEFDAQIKAVDLLFGRLGI